MQMKKLAKGVMIALPLFALAACSTTDQAEDQVTDSQETVVDETQTSVITPELTPEEKQQQMYAELRQSYTLYFDFDKSEIKGEFADLLAAHADYLVKNPSVNVKIEGHADERGTPEYNIALGDRRAKAVSKYLMSLGVSSSQLTTVSYGEELPLDTAHNDAAWAKNRRAVLNY